MKGRNYSATGTVFPFVATLVDRSVVFGKRSDSARRNSFYTDKVSATVFDHKGDACGTDELLKFRSKTRNFDSADDKMFALHC